MFGLHSLNLTRDSFALTKTAEQCSEDEIIIHLNI